MKFQNIKIANNLNNIRAFSLIELSIVLIIIGLLVAGITAGASLIASARSKALANEILNWKQAILTFKAVKGRYPGDINNIGMFGGGSGYTYTVSTFPAPFNSAIPGVYDAPFIELYLEKISDFKPTINGGTCISYPCFKSYPDIYFIPRCCNLATSTEATNYLYNYRRTVLFEIHSKANYISPKIMKTVDVKIDDGAYNGGTLRTNCSKKIDGSDTNEGYTSYDDSINTKSKCNYAFYDLKLW